MVIFLLVIRMFNNALISLTCSTMNIEQAVFSSGTVITGQDHFINTFISNQTYSLLFNIYKHNHLSHVFDMLSND